MNPVSKHCLCVCVCVCVCVRNRERIVKVKEIVPPMDKHHLLSVNMCTSTLPPAGPCSWLQPCLIFTWASHHLSAPTWWCRPGNCSLNKPCFLHDDPDEWTCFPTEACFVSGALLIKTGLWSVCSRSLACCHQSECVSNAIKTLQWLERSNNINIQRRETFIKLD